jgi:hypothetical protein
MTRRPRRGAGAVEFALTLPFLMFLTMGIIELSMLMHRNYIVSRAARDAARIASGVMEGANPNGNLIEAAAEEQAGFVLQAAGIDCDDLDCEIIAEWIELDDWMMVQVTVGVPYTPFTELFPLVPEMTARSFTMLTQQQQPPDPP